MYVVSRVVSSDSRVLLVIVVCLQEPQDTVAPPNRKRYPVVDLTSSLSVIQLAPLLARLV